ncbi:MAG: Crp/Fnr family transcriptional regulator [Chloroflexi bacterium]|nr:Crp/Fnr family transcriptional regulator [Chloroflexota bacterium]
MSSRLDFIRSLPYFAGLSDETAGRIEEQIRELSFAKGETLLLEGEPCRGLYVVKTGRVRIFKSSLEGREQVLLIAGPKSTFNDVPVFDGGPNPASGSALEPTTVYVIPREAMLSLVADCPAAMNIIRLFAARLRHLTMLVEDLSFRSVVSRLAKALLDLAVATESQAPVPRLTQDEMAAMIGTVRDVISRALKALEKEGAIKIEGRRILVVDPDKLRKMV